MSFSRRTSRIYMDEYDVQGALNALARRIEEGADDAPFFIGAHLALNLIYNHEDIRDQSVFLQLFDNQIAQAKQEGTM